MKNFTSSKEKSCLAHYEFKLLFTKATYSSIQMKAKHLVNCKRNITSYFL